MNAGYLKVHSRCYITNPLPFRGRDVRDVFGQCERGYLNTVIARLPGKGHRVIEFPILKDFIADGEFHAGTFFNQCPHGKTERSYTILLP
jgi:hypothetical protein